MWIFFVPHVLPNIHLSVHWALLATRMIRVLLCKTRNVNIEVNMEELSMIEKLNIAKITELYTYFRHESHEREQLRTGPIREFPRGPGANFYFGAPIFPKNVGEKFFPDKHQLN